MIKRVLVTATSVGLISCGGGSGSDAQPPGQTSERIGASEKPAYVSGRFEPSDKFKNSCGNPRTGIDPFTEAAFTDRQGLLEHENFWLRSWADETYLWYDEIVDQDPDSFGSPQVYFDELKTNRTTASGNPVDRFHFLIPSDEWFEQSRLSQSLSYGARYVQTGFDANRELRIAYVEPNSPASNAGWERGDFVVSVDGVSLVDATTALDLQTINRGLAPNADSPTHTIQLRKRDSATVLSQTMTAQVITEQAVLDSRVIDSNGQRIGYLLFNDHNATAEQQLIAAVEAFRQANIDELVLDVRYNGGGFLAIASQLSAMIVGPSSFNEVFENSVYNDKLDGRHPVTGERVPPMPFISETIGLSVNEGQALPTLNLERVVMLTSGNTCSASESIINGLQGIDFEVVLVGSTTCGKPYGFFPEDNCGTTYFTIQLAGQNAKGFGDFADGFAPANASINVGVPVSGCEVFDDFEHDLGSADEARLSEALFYLHNGRCSLDTATQVFTKTRVQSQEKLLRQAWKEIKF